VQTVWIEAVGRTSYWIDSAVLETLGWRAPEYWPRISPGQTREQTHAEAERSAKIAMGCGQHLVDCARFQPPAGQGVVDGVCAERKGCSRAFLVEGCLRPDATAKSVKFNCTSHCGVLGNGLFSLRWGNSLKNK
jgi:hypothetical protein